MRCPLSWRAWDVRRYLYVERGVSLRELQHSAIAVGSGIVKGKTAVYIGTNDARIDAMLRSPRLPLQQGEELAFSPRKGEHAEQTVERMFAARGVDMSRGVIIGSDPKGCEGRCTPRYQAHNWIRHERPTEP